MSENSFLLMCFGIPFVIVLVVAGVVSANKKIPYFRALWKIYVGIYGIFFLISVIIMLISFFSDF